VIHGLEDVLAARLHPFLQQQRWFGGKARTVRACEVEDWAEIGGGHDVAVVVAAVIYADDARERYGLLLARRPEAGGLPTLGQLGDSGSGWIIEAAGDPGATGRLLRGFAAAGDVPTRRGGVLRYGDVSRTVAGLVTRDGYPVTGLGADQSNTSLRIGQTLVFKLFRRLEPGENPELEVGRFLTSRTSFRAMSALEGSLTYVSPQGAPSTLAVLQSWIDNEGDGWRYALRSLTDALHAGAGPSRLPDDARLLGEVTADLHAALESGGDDDAFEPEPVQRRDIDGWTAGLQHRISQAHRLIQSRLAPGTGETGRLAAAALSRAERTSTVVSLIADSPAGAFVKIRIHGDYHLGQTLKTATGFAVVDFEGEPARSLADRRQKHCALKDVAGMLRSFDYAIETVCQDQRELAPTVRASLRLDESFVEAYLHRARFHRAASIPADRETVDRWLTFFQFDKALYELEYEVNNRPEWAHIPLRGILRALEPMP
jgi:maltose alpha-D-glucosyltransferase/alpha-amylase